MAPEAPAATAEQAPAGETPPEAAAPEPQQQGTPAEPAGQDTQLPDDHPLVKTLAANKAKIAAQNSELAELRAKSAQATKLETELAARPTQEALDTLQTRYDRLEAFLIAAGGPLSKALDSRTFTKDLFETDKDVAELAKAWHKANPTATSTALGAAGQQGQEKAPDMNALLRAALKS